LSDNFVNPTSVNVTWNSSWKKWDGTSYTSDYAAGYTETTPLVYQVEYSRDNGDTWQFCANNATAKVGVKNPGNWTTATTLAWDVSNTASFPKGSYILKVECYRRDIDLHYSYDQIQLYFSR
jgi:hypothetical protein